MEGTETNENLEKEFELHVDEVMGLIKDGTPRSEIENEVRHNMDYYRLSIGDSKRRTVRRHGGSAESIIGDLKMLKITDVVEEKVDYNIKGVVKMTSPKLKAGTMTTTGVISDDSGEIEFTIWEEMMIEPGKTYVFKRCQFSEKYQSVSVRYSSNVIPIDGGHAEKVDPIKRMAEMTVKIADLNANSNGKTVCASVERVIDAMSKNGPYQKVTLRDDSGSMIFNDWGSHKLQIGERYMITNIQTKTMNDGRVFYNMNDRSNVTKMV